MRVRIETREGRLTARSASQFLNALLLLREGLALAFLDEGTDLLEGAIRDEGRSTISALSQAGRDFMSGVNWPNVAWHTRARIVYSVTQRAVTTEEMDLELLENGSAVGVIKELIKGIERIIQNALSAANDLLPGNDGRDFANALRGTLQATNASQATLNLAAGMCSIAAGELRTAFASMDAESVGVEVDIEVEANA